MPVTVWVVFPKVFVESCVNSTLDDLYGVDLRPLPLEQRKDQLRKLLFGSARGIEFSEHLEDDGATVFAHACLLGCEGIVSKDRSRPYGEGPSKTWVKIKNPQAPGVRRFEDRT